MSTPPWLDIVIGRTLRFLGSPIVARSILNFRNGFTVTDDPAANTTHVDASGGGGGGTGALIVATQNALKALTRAQLTDGQSVVVKSTNTTWVWSAATGAGFAGDDRTLAQLTEGVIGDAGRFYIADGAPVVPTYAATRLAVSGVHATIHVQSRSTLDDGGGGTFVYDANDTTSADNDGTILVAGTRRYKRVFTGALHAAWFGVVGDGKFVTDGVVTAGSPTLTSASAGFKAGDSTKRILARVAQHLAAGTISNSGATLNGTGTAVATDMPIIADGGGGVGQALSGGCIYCDGQFLAVQFVLTATEQLQLATTPSAIVAKPYYTETQLATSMAFVNATTVTLGGNAAVAQTGVQFFYATDSTSALDNAVLTALALGITELVLPKGYIGVSANLAYVDKSHLTIRGPGMGKCCLVDLRRASTYYTTGPSGMLSFSSSAPGVATDVHLVDFSYDGSVPVLGMTHSSTPGFSNGSGRRIGFWMQHMTNSSYQVGGGLVVGTGRYGARDEHAYVDGQSDDFTFDQCNIVGNNNVSINCNGGFNGDGNPQPDRLKILSPRATGILVSAATYLIDHPDCSPGGLLIEGGITVDKIGHGIINVPLIHGYTLGQGVGMIDCFGNTRSDASLAIVSPTFAENTGPWFTGGGASCIHLSGFAGLCKISGITSKGNASSGVGGREVLIEGAATGQIHIEGGHYDGGTDISIAIEIVAGVPDGAVTIAPNQRYGSSIATRWKLGAALGDLDTGGVL